jgi:enoyl-CoA hydratase
MGTDSPLRVERKGEVGSIILSDPDRLNVLGTPALHALLDALRGMKEDRRIRVLIITGIKHFCAGADIREMKVKNPEEAGNFARLGHGVCDAIEDMDKPVIAAICGYCLGGGCEIALACDIRLASENVKLGQPEINLGLIPGFGGTQRLTRLVGIGRAKELVFSGRIVSAAEAESIGLVSKVAKDEGLLQLANETAQKLAQMSPAALAAAKRLINDNFRIRGGLEAEIGLFSKCFATEDHIEGIEAFLEKRPPRFKGK